MSIDEQFKQKIVRPTTLVYISLNDVKLKWRNFVDDD